MPTWPLGTDWAVSTTTDRQTATDSFAAKGEAYGVRNVRVDGNDPLAVYAVTREAHELAPEEGATLIEAVTYRLGFHTSSDNPDLYRLPEEVTAWEAWDPLNRTRRYLEKRQWWSEAQEQALHESCLADIQAAIETAEGMTGPTPGDIFDDIHAEPTWRLEEQRRRLLADLGQED